MARKLHGVAGVALCAGIICVSGVGAGQTGTGGITFSGKKAGQCVVVEGQDIARIVFLVDTCDEMGQEKPEYQGKVNFTLLVPEGTHRFKVVREGKQILMKAVTIKPEQTVQVDLPE